MTEITYQGRIYGCRAGESLLDAFLRQGAGLPFSCRNGVCQVCLQRSLTGEPPAESQRGLKQSLADRHYFLACLCRPDQDMGFGPPLEEDLYFTAQVAAREQLAKDIYRILLDPSLELDYRSGQFINVRRPDGVSRSYSLASVPGEDPYLELHIKRMKNGAMSNWLIDELEVNSEIEIQGPNGHCFHAPRNAHQNLLLVGTGTGLAPLLGIVRTALASVHQGQIYLYHGSSHCEGLYLVDELRGLARKASNFHYLPCVSSQAAPAHHGHGRAHAVAFARHADLVGWRLHLAGNPDMVNRAAGLAAIAGVDAEDILDDAFVLKDLRASPRDAPEEKRPLADRDRMEFPPDPEMWAALQEGKLMGAILTDFYTRAFDDPVLSPYFSGVTKRRLIEKVYSFMRQVFTGEKLYFGDRPRNAHHWMVIPPEVFDYREELMVSCMRRHGLAEPFIQRWQAIEERFREDIVKAKPIGRVRDGIELPVDGFGQTVLEVGALCDSCMQAIDPGEEVSYHLRLGHIYCRACREA